jgi:cell division transport system permease protein
MSGWLARHLQALLFALGRLVRAPWATGFTVAVIALALTLPAGFALLVESASRVSDQAATAIDISVYFKLDTPLPAVQQRAVQLRTRPDVSAVQVITAEQALRQLQWPLPTRLCARASPRLGRWGRRGCQKSS